MSDTDAAGEVRRAGSEWLPNSGVNRWLRDRISEWARIPAMLRGEDTHAAGPGILSDSELEAMSFKELRDHLDKWREFLSNNNGTRAQEDYEDKLVRIFNKKRTEYNKQVDDWNRLPTAQRQAYADFDDYVQDRTNTARREAEGPKPTTILAWTGKLQPAYEAAMRAERHNIKAAVEAYNNVVKLMNEEPLKHLLAAAPDSLDLDPNPDNEPLNSAELEALAGQMEDVANRLEELEQHRSEPRGGPTQ